MLCGYVHFCPIYHLQHLRQLIDFYTWFISFAVMRSYLSVLYAAVFWLISASDWFWSAFRIYCIVPSAYRQQSHLSLIPKLPVALRRRVRGSAENDFSNLTTYPQFVIEYAELPTRAEMWNTFADRRTDGQLNRIVLERFIRDAVIATAVLCVVYYRCRVASFRRLVSPRRPRRRLTVHSAT